MPNFSDLAKQGIRFRTLETAQQEEPVQEQGNFSRGFEKAMLQVPQTLGGTLALAGDVAGIEGLKEYGLGVYQNNSDKIQVITKDADSLSNVLDGDASAGDWLANNSGYVAGQALQAVATGGLGGFIGSQLAKRGIAGVVARGAESLAARQVAQKVASRGAKAGAATALFGSNLSQEAGSIYPEALHVAKAEGRELDGQDKARVVGSAVAAAGVDTAMDALMLGRVMTGARRGGEGIVKAGLREIPLAATREGVTEGIQTGIERYGAGQELNTADAIRDYVDSVGVGVLGGGMGGSASIIRSQKVPESGPLTRAANTSIEQQVLQLEYDPQPLISFPDGSVGHKQDLQAYLTQFPEGEERTRREREIMGRDPETGKRIQPEPEPEQKFVPNEEAEAQNLAAWGARHEGVPLAYAQSLIAAPGAKGMNLMIVPHPKGTDYTVIPSKWLTLDTQAKYGALQKGEEGMLPGPDREAPGGAIRVDSEGGAARETYGDQVRTGQEARDQETAGELLAQRERDMGKSVPNGARIAPAAAGPIPTLTDQLAPADGIPVLNDVITAPSGSPFKSEFAAKRRMAEGGYAETHDLLPVDGGFILQPKAEVTNANDAVLAQDDSAARGSSDQIADLAGQGQIVGDRADAQQPGEGRADVGTVDGVSDAGAVRATGSADADAALIEQAANEAATSPTNDLPEPSQAQKEAGNYKVGRVKVHGLDISIENPAGSTRKGVAPDGTAWENQLAHHYGYIRRTEGADGDHVDAFIGPNPDSDRVFVVDQIDPATGRFDEHKILLGFDSLEEASAGYAANYEAGWKGGKNISETSSEGFKAWLKSGDTKKPYAPQAEKENANVPERPQVPEETAPAPRAQGARQAEESRTADADRDDGADIPLAFYKRVKVQHEVFVEETGKTETVEVPADQALRSVREDKENLQALLKCMKGGA